MIYNSINFINFINFNTFGMVSSSLFKIHFKGKMLQIY